MFPIKGGKVNYAYGSRNSRYQKGYHTGSDIFAREGTPVMACRPGVIERSGSGVLGPSLGTAVVIKATAASGGKFDRYCHLSAATVKVGQVVKAGDVIGKVGSTGTNSTGPHLHVERGATAGWGTDEDPKVSFDWTPKPTPEPPKGKGVKHTVHANGGLHARVAPSLSAAIKKTLPDGSSVSVFATKDGWSQIKSGLWVKSEFIKKAK